jgi:AraC-like DNA-binding protein
LAVNWMQNLSRAIHYIENNLTNEISVEDVSKAAYSSSSNFQRIFNLVTGITIGDYIRNRRLTLAGQELLNKEEKIIDVAMRYQYDTPESFSKAFTRFHDISPSSLRKQRCVLRIFQPLTIKITIQGGFGMSRKLIDKIPIHQLQYPNQGQNYVFNGCMKFLMECMGEDEQYDYWFFSAVSGDCYVQVFNTNKEKWSTCFSHAKFDYDLVKRVFDSIGYNFTYLEAEDWRKNKEVVKAKIIEYIDKGIPIIGKGFYHPPPEEGMPQLPTDEVSCIIGYENDGKCFYRLPEEATELVPFTLDDNLPYTFVFIKEKKEAPPIADAYKKALLEAPRLMQTPSSQTGDVFFGNDAFEQWANILEGDFYLMTKEEYDARNAIASWRYYCVYICIIATNIFSKQHTTDRAIRLNPDLASLIPLLDQEYKELDELENRLKEAGGDFNISYEVLQNAEKRKKIACILREFPKVYRRICDIIEHGNIKSNISFA